MTDPAEAATPQSTPYGDAHAQLSPSEQLMYSTVRLQSPVPGGVRTGTGFLYSFFNQDGKSVAAIITNKHVVDGLSSLEFSLHKRGRDGRVDLDNHMDITLTDLPNRTVYHPDNQVDLVAIIIPDRLNELEKAGTLPFIVTLEQSLIPTSAQFQDLFPVEQVLTVGYPGMLWDDVHKLPLFHRGYTSTPPYVAFQGRPEFLIDIATWPGASGSPVFLFNDGGWVDRGGTHLGGLRVMLLGIVFAVGMGDVHGNVTVQAAPTQVVLQGAMAVPTNIGLCVRADKILDFEPELIKRGTQQPKGYVMRAAGH